jgi:hypothetical protein
MPKGTTPSQPKYKDPIGSIGAAAQATATPNPTPNMFATTPQFGTTPQAQFSPQSNFYQVTAQDTDMSAVAAKNNLPLQQLVDANQSKELPPEGSYIQLGTQQFPGTPPTSSAATNKYLQEGRGDPAAQNLRNQASQITTQLAAGQLPNSIPSAVVGFMRDKNGQRITIQELIAEGYVMNAQGVLVLAGGPGSPGGGHAPSAEYAKTAGYQANKDKSFLQQLRYDPKKKKLVKIGDLIRQGRLDIKTGRMYNNPMKRNKKGKLVAAERPQQAVPVTAPIESQVTTETYQTILDIHLGSG